MGQNKEVRTIPTHWANSIYSRSSIVDQWGSDEILINSAGTIEESYRKIK